MIENWRPVIDYKDYQVSDLGRIKNIVTGIVRQPTKDGRYVGVRGSRSICIAFAALRAFVGEPPTPYGVGVGKTCARHLDDDTHNNKLSNLAWGTQKDNMQDASHNGKDRFVTVRTGYKHKPETIAKMRATWKDRPRPWLRKPHRRKGSMTIESECQEVTGVKPRAKESRQKFLGRLVKAIEELDEAEWAKLSDETQAWYKKALKADEQGEDILDFPDATNADVEGTDDEAEEKKEVAAAKKPAAKKKANGDGKTTKAKGAAAKGTGYKGHREGSRKESIHKIFDEKGFEAAIKAAEKADLSALTAKSWIYSWGGKAPKKAKESART